MKIFCRSSGNAEDRLSLSHVVGSVTRRKTRRQGRRQGRQDSERPEFSPRLPRSADPVRLGSLGGRGFILLRTGFFGGGITSAVPPLASIFSAADLEKWSARTVSFLVSSPLPRMRTPSAGPLARPALRRAA